MERATPSILCSYFVIVLILLLLDTSVAEPRSQIVQNICGNRKTMGYVTDFADTMETITQQMSTRGYGVAFTGTGPLANYGLGQCYGDFSLRDRIICYTEARYVLPHCFPSNGQRIYLDGCFMRVENYTFYDQYLGPEDRRVCGNRMAKGSLFQQTARRAVQQAISNAPSNKGYARSQVSVPGPSNETAYVLANCWKTLSVNSCAACLQNASAFMLGCLPWSEGRALYTGCFMSYLSTEKSNSDDKWLFLLANDHIAGKVVVIVVSSAVILGVGAFIGTYVWSNKQIQKKRKGKSLS
ncbi:cysteine-rich receptor-like protein kinase 2 [Lycium ferocissimum]|uniref:cysteine-rich receptor-like protein kinase 2 n=1 Tax=Lycium ferocissimum TaxID=112874 RepID=UPI0028166E85|nr:cysteine-rich receptor-like protein kinase 2 [Lycium ferocissimum]